MILEIVGVPEEPFTFGTVVMVIPKVIVLLMLGFKYLPAFTAEPMIFFHVRGDLVPCLEFTTAISAPRTPEMLSLVMINLGCLARQVGIAELTFPMPVRLGKMLPQPVVTSELLVTTVAVCHIQVGS